MNRSSPADTLLVSADTLAARLDCSRSTIDAYVKAGHLPPPLMIGPLPRWDFSEVLEHIRARNQACDGGRKGVGINGRSPACDAYSPGIRHLGTAEKP